MKTRLVVVGTALLIAWALKRHYAEARADDLWWVLTPTARLAGVITGAAFEMQPGEGYLSRERMFLIEKSCAGVNFIIAAFGMLMFARFHHVASPLSAARLLAASVLVAYLVTVMVNTVRIAIAMWLAAHPVARSTLSAAEVHRIEGIVVYFGGLVLLYELTVRFDRRAPRGCAS
jgi:exosortase K